MAANYKSNLNYIKNILCLSSGLIILLLSSLGLNAQNLITNGNFNASGANWTFLAPATSTEAYLTETTYGGTDATNIVAEIDYQSNLRQVNIPVTPGTLYRLSFKHSRRNVASNPNSINVKIYNGATTFLTQDIVSSNATWLWQCKSFDFTPTTSTVDIDFINITGNNATLGTMVDDITISPVAQPVTTSGSLCPGSNLTLTAPSSVAGATYTNYSWTGPGGFTATGATATVNNIQTAQNGVYICTMTLNGCMTVTASYTLTVLTPPDLSFLNNNDLYICSNGQDTITLANASILNTYQWHKDNILIPGATNGSLVVSALGVYKVIATSPEGCVDTSGEIEVFNNVISVDFSFDIHKACNNDTVIFTNLSQAGQYIWDFGDLSALDTATDPTHIYQTQNSYTVKLIATSVDGCVDSAFKIVDVTHPIAASFTQSADSICENAGLPIDFFNTSTGALTGWNWTFGDGGSSTAQNPNHLYTAAGIYPVRLVVNDNIPCYDTATSIVVVDSVPMFKITQDRHAICTGEQVNFVPQYATSIQNISWNYGDGGAWDEIGSTAHHYEQPGLYSIVTTADFGVCGLATITDSVVVSAYPKVDLGADATLCLDGDIIVLSDKNSATDASWHWNTGATTATINVVHPGIYSVTKTVLGCATTEQIEITKDCYMDIPNAFTPNGDGIDDYFFPRQMLSKGVVGFSMTIFNRWGQKIFETTNPDGRGWDGSFNGKNQPMGVYIYNISGVLKNGRTEKYTGNVSLLR